MTALLAAVPWLGMACGIFMGAVLTLAALGVRSARAALAEREAVAERWAAALDRRHWELWRREMASLQQTPGGTP